MILFALALSDIAGAIIPDSEGFVRLVLNAHVSRHEIDVLLSIAYTALRMCYLRQQDVRPYLATASNEVQSANDDRTCP